MHKLSNYSQEEQKLKRFVFFAECFLVKGALRTAIYDLCRNTYKFIPNDLANMIEQFEGKTLAEVKEFYGAENEAIVDKYFDFLEKGEYIFWCDEDEVELFPKIDLEFDYPAHISNVIIDIDAHSTHNLPMLFEQIEKLGCRYIQFRSFTEQPLSFWEQILKDLSATAFKAIEIITKYTSAFTFDRVKELYDNNMRIHAFIVHSSPEYFFQEKTEENPNIERIAFIEEAINSAFDGHKMHPGYFSVNRQLFMEAHHHHTYFNRKLCIDTNGDIKNCNTLPESFGNVRDTPLKEAIAKDGFQALWNVKKDDTKVCKDCEFRYMCVDARTPLMGDDGLYYHEMPCAYDPYAAKWGEAVETEATLTK